MRCIFLLFVLIGFCYLTKSFSHPFAHHGHCPTYEFHCFLACTPELKQSLCKNNPLCCKSDRQCARYQKCCQPACGCNTLCTNTTN